MESQKIKPLSLADYYKLIEEGTKKLEIENAKETYTKTEKGI